MSQLTKNENQQQVNNVTGNDNNSYPQQQQPLYQQQQGGNFSQGNGQQQPFYPQQQIDGNIIFNGGQQQQRNVSNGNKSTFNKKKHNNKKKPRGNFQKGGNKGGYQGNNNNNNNDEVNVKNKRWSEEELVNLFGEYNEVMSKFLDEKTKTHELLVSPLTVLVEQLDACTKTNQPSKLAKSTFNEFRKVAEGICRVLISENSENFNKEEIKHFVGLLKDLKQVKIKSKLNEKDLQKELAKLYQSLENIKRIGKFGSNFNLPDPSSLGDACSSILYNLVISIESLHTVLGKKEKFWPKLGADDTTTTTSSNANVDESKGKQNSKKKKVRKTYKKKAMKKNSSLSKKIVLEFGKVDKQSQNYQGLYDENDDLTEESENPKGRGGNNNSSSSGDKPHHYKRNNKRTTQGGNNNNDGGNQQGGNNNNNNNSNGGGRSYDKKSSNEGGKRTYGGSNNQQGKKKGPQKKRGGGKKPYDKNGGGSYKQKQQQQGGEKRYQQVDNNNYNGGNRVYPVQQQQQQQQYQQQPKQDVKKDGDYQTRQPFGVGFHYVINKKVWKNLDAVKEDGTLETKDRDDKALTQQWKFEHLGIGFFRIIHKPTNKALSRNEKDELKLEDLNNKKNQNWIMVKQFFGRKAYYLIFNAEKTKTLVLDETTNVVSIQFKNGPSELDAWKIK